MTTVKAVVVDRSVENSLALQDAPYPQAHFDEALVRVKAVSLNRGEVRWAASAENGFRPGWDFAGVVEQAAANGAGPKVGDRVVGLLNPGAWAEVVAVPTHALAVLPDSVTFAQAATLPVAGLTALQTIEMHGSVLGKKVLITGASGGVGHFAVQLGHHMGAHTVALIRNEKWREQTQRAGASEIVISPNAEAAAASAPYDLIIDGVGGQTLSQALGYVAPDGLIITYGRTAGRDAVIDLKAFLDAGSHGASIYGYLVFHEITKQPAGVDLRRLAELVAQGGLVPLIGLEAPITDIGSAAKKLLDRDFPGKAVLSF